MNNLAAVHLEMQARKRNEQYETEREQRTSLYTLFRAPVAEDSTIRHMAGRLGELTVGLGDFLAGLRCQLQSRFASEPAATAC
jgi:hypothetical protein